MKKLPIGIQTFENLIREGFAYVDKTQFVSSITLQGKYYFLSRPRRFGKSLFLSTLKAAFEGKRDLFEDLYLYDNWDWSETNMDRLREIFHSFFASIPYDCYKEQQTAGYEAYYASIVYCYFAATGIDVRPEVHSNKGRLDLLVRLDNRVYVIEFKVVEQCGKEKALEQIKSKGYAEQFAGREIYLIGVEFSREKRNIESFEWEKAE